MPWLDTAIAILETGSMLATWWRGCGALGVSRVGQQEGEPWIDVVEFLCQIMTPLMIPRSLHFLFLSHATFVCSLLLCNFPKTHITRQDPTWRRTLLLPLVIHLWILCHCITHSETDYYCLYKRAEKALTLLDNWPAIKPDNVSCLPMFDGNSKSFGGPFLFLDPVESDSEVDAGETASATIGRSTRQSCKICNEL